MNAAWPLLAILLITLPAVLAQPTLDDDDAGSGTDAGDDRANALPVAPGRFSARLVPGVDDYDWYAFQATAGQSIRVRLLTNAEAGTWVEGQVHTPEGATHFATSRWYGPIWIAGLDTHVPAELRALSSGTYYLEVRHDPLAPVGLGYDVRVEVYDAA